MKIIHAIHKQNQNDTFHALLISLIIKDYVSVIRKVLSNHLGPNERLLCSPHPTSSVNSSIHLAKCIRGPDD